ncbi:DNA recombination protein RmuC-like [Nostocoides japonicum T1-X7]|uniref:DNA recombination protein RmuC-like n=1 Tax=Nostocoides japonicum T1-X7 TaxID=1194083 RepID=A0A077M5P0_9MICO|nr:DNA recombination protein RmuC [Tetrasphaera japonica]CCH80372.1 DNA recombination protein RmuC-like [Tetrasphaera japonica T1-X7]
MTLWITGLVGLIIGALLAYLYAESGRAALRAERDLLRERVVDLEAAVADDAQTAAALAPLREALTRVEQQVGTLERDRVEHFGALRSVLHRVEGETAALGAQTRSLAGSLNASSVRGAWGEVQLRRILELTGMLARCDFEEQVSAVSGHDVRVRPDVVVRLPGDKVLVLDAKAPMTAFLQAQAEDVDGPERAALLREHARALSRHVHDLSAKAYWSAFTTTPEMVVCFVPTEAMLSAALGADPSLHEQALARRVALVGPASLMALLRTVAFTWQQDALAGNARELLALGRELHDRLGTLGGHVSTLGRSLSRSVESYNQLVGALESRVLVSARRMTDLGLVPTRLDAVAPLDSTPRVLTAMELIEAATADDRRPELDDPAHRRPAGRNARDDPAWNAAGGLGRKALGELGRNAGGDDGGPPYPDAETA